MQYDVLMVLLVTRAIRNIEDKTDCIIASMRYIKTRQRTIFLSCLKDIMNHLIKDERYKEAAEIQKIIEMELKDGKHTGTEYEQQ